MGLIINGKQVAANLRESLRGDVEALQAKGREPTLAVVLVGEDPASQVYVRNKTRACQDVGVKHLDHFLPATTSADDLLKLVRKLNKDPNVHGILIQLPLPAHINAQQVIETIDPSKDVDGFHPVNQGALFVGDPRFVPCTPAGVMALLTEVVDKFEGLHAVVIGRSNIVGKPVAQLLLKESCTVTIAHSKSRDLASLVKQGDIVVAAAGRAELIKGEWIREGAYVIDVGINRGADGKLVGDVEFATAQTRTKAITPVPGGVGPMTIAMLLKNTILACTYS